MRKLLPLITFLSFFLFKSLSGQEAVAPAGNFHQNEAMSVSWTLGELAIETLVSGDIILTQGLQQSNLTVVSVDELAGSDLQISVYPNPTRDILNVKMDNQYSENISYSVIDFSGRTIAGDRIWNQNEQISFAGLNAGVYFVKVSIDGTLSKTFKIVKQ